MLIRLILILTIVPIAELYLLLAVHGAIAERTNTATGLAVTIGAVLLTGVLGATLARIQGASIVRKLFEAMARGQFPGDAIIDGAMILVGAVLLLAPGFLTDIVGLTFLLPGTREIHRRFIVRWIRGKIARGEVSFGAYPGAGSGGASPGRGESRPADGLVIDVTPAEEPEPGC